MTVNKLQADQLILIAEDSDDDYEATIRALKQSGNLANTIIRCINGQEVMDYLNCEGVYASKPDWRRPGIILLDLNMPGVCGRTALKELKSSKDHRDIPIVVLTTSDDEKDIEGCYLDGANSYIHKPVDLDGFFKAIRQLKEYWFEIAILPKKAES